MSDHALADVLRSLARVAREEGLRRVQVYDHQTGITYRFDAPPMVSPKAASAPSPAILPVSVPNTETAADVRDARKKQLAAYRDAVECAHVNGWPDPADYGLSQGDVA